MQLSLRRQDQITDIVYVGINIYAALFAIAAIAAAIASPWIARAWDDTSGIPFLIVLGLMGLFLARIEYLVFRDLAQQAKKRRQLRRDARIAAEKRLTEALTARPAALSFVRVLESVWTPFGMIHPDDVGVVTHLELDDDSLVSVKWPRGENVMDYHFLAAES